MNGRTCPGRARTGARKDHRTAAAPREREHSDGDTGRGAREGATASVEAGVRDFTERWLPSRGWRRVLLRARTGGAEAGFLIRRGYDVTLLEGGVAQKEGGDDGFDPERAQPATTSLAAAPRRAFDAVLLLDPLPTVDERTVRRVASRALRRGGLLVLGAALSDLRGPIEAATLGLVSVRARPGGLAAYWRWAR